MRFLLETSRLCAVYLLIAAPVGAQEESGALEVTARWRTYLDRRPTHPRVFDEMVAVAVDAGGVADLIAHYRTRRSADPDDRATAIVLARLLSWSGVPSEALELLERFGEAETEVLELRGRLSAEMGDAQEAQVLLRRAFDAAVDDAARERTLRGLSQVQRRAGAFGPARDTLLELARSAPDDGSLQIEVAGLLGDLGCGGEARALNARALELATDVPRRCDALAALGRQQEADQLGAEALASYEELLGLLGPGHWMRSDTLERTIELHATGGSLEEWVEARRADLSSARTPRVALDVACGLEALGRTDEATALLAATRSTFPRDEALASASLAAARATGAHDEVVKLLQERVDARSDDLDARLALATGLRAAGRIEAAELVLHDAADRAADADELRRVAAAWGDLRSARPLLERAAVLAPDDPVPWLDLALLLAELADDSAAADALEEAARRADPETLLVVARVWSDLGRSAEAEATLLRAASHERMRAAALDHLSDLHEAAGDTRAARETLWDLAAWVDDARRMLALARWAATHVRDDETRHLLLDLGPRRHVETDTTLAVLAQAALADHLGEDGVAAERLRVALLDEPDDHFARAARVDALSRAGELEAALEEQRTLVAREPRLRVQHLMGCAALSLRMRRTSEALATLGRARQAAWDSAFLLRPIAARYRALRRRGEALDVLERVLQLDPGDAGSALSAARLHVGARRVDAARRHYLAALRATADADAREAILDELHRTLREGESRGEELERLTRCTLRNPYDREAPELLVSLLRADRRYAELNRIGSVLVERRPDDARWRQARSRGRAMTGDVDGALADLGHLLAAGATPTEVVECVAQELVRLDDPRLAKELGKRVDDVSAACAALRRKGGEQAAADLAAGFAREHGLEGEGVLDLLLALRPHLREASFALSVLDAAAARDGMTVVLAHRLGGLHHDLGQTDEVREYGRVLLDLGAPAKMVERYYDRFGLAGFLTEDRAAVGDL